MSADLHIHAMTEDMTEQDLRVFFSHTLGSRWGVRLGPQGLIGTRYTREEEDAAHKKVMDTDNIWIGEVSWLKAMVTEDQSEYIPSVVSAVSDIIGESMPVLDEALFQKLVGAFEAPNKTGYTVSNGEDPVSWLRSHMGARLFTVSW